MKYVILLGLSMSIALLSLNVYSQTNTFPSSGNVGIGTSSPLVKTDIVGSLSTTTPENVLLLARPYNAGVAYVSSAAFALSNQYPDNTRLDFKLLHANTGGSYTVPETIVMSLLSGGNVGIGTTVPLVTLQTLGSYSLPATSGTSCNGMFLVGGLNHGIFMGVSSSSPYGGWLQVQDKTNLALNYPLLLNPNGGNVGIGTTNPGNYKLNVYGSIRANEVVVNTDGADYVFAPDYKLLSLHEVESFIIENNHLPDLSPAVEMQEKGMNVSEMQTKLLQKIEELTLYVIEQNKRIELLEKKNNKLKK